MTCDSMALEGLVVVALQAEPVQLQESPLVPETAQEEMLAALHETLVVAPDSTSSGMATISPWGVGGGRQAPFEQP